MWSRPIMQVMHRHMPFSTGEKNLMNEFGSGETVK